MTKSNLSNRINRDGIMMASRDRASHVAHAMLAGGNKEKGPMLAAGTAILFAVMADRTGMTPQDLYQLGRKLLEPQEFHDKPNKSLESLRDFATLRVNTVPSI